ncbi:FBXL12 isoform 2 [Pan troglodytes]|uniref:F-box and leucine rich repeat protein 12 n=7 Tax=Catarrhini TaxID=9526 RepID=K7EQJ7_HUMAN|nr:F-box and leucine rich repeat protein 12 [Homo sapiens]KAI4040241.1 F-box and leucine rich repeat protein 12 [Homo sapiens]PNI51708.1 FBXL12 isoform 2 [Pan troglodytes]
MATLVELPDSVLLEIFSYLPVRDRIRISRCDLKSCGTSFEGTWHPGSIPCGWVATCSLAPRPPSCPLLC